MSANKLQGGRRIRNIEKVSRSSEPLVSIITVVFNGEKYLEQTILSVLNQTYSNIEYIVIDGGSSDATLDIINKYTDKIDYWVSEPDSGIYDAMNKGISLATGQLIGIINSDDWYELDAVEEIVRAYKDGSTIIYGFMRHIVEEKPIEVYAAYPVSIPCKMIPHSTCFVPKFIYDQYGTFDLSYRSCADYHFILRLYKEGISFSILEKILANFRFGGFSFKSRSLIESFNMRYKMGYISNYQRIIKIIGIYVLSAFKIR